MVEFEGFDAAENVKIHHFWVGVGLAALGLYLIWHDYQKHKEEGTLDRMLRWEVDKVCTIKP